MLRMCTAMAFLRYILFAVVICSVLGQDSSLPRVTISQGTVVGSNNVDDGYYEFYGIPYADSTAGPNRFKAPSAPPTFGNEFVANRRDIKCVRAVSVGYEGTEDCLTVNVLTPTLNATSRLPVMVWIQGQELDKVNEPELSFRRFLEKNVIIVDINYRESILGFLCLGTDTAPGNAGLKDIIAGLRWVQENIVLFGGDPDNVSIFGHGSGAAVVDLITLTPLSEGLIHKAIAQSGTALAPWAVTRNNLKHAVDVAQALGHIVQDIEMLSDVFTRISIAALMAVINELDLTDNSLAFAPCVERELENSEALLLISPYQTIMEGKQLQIPFMTGFVDLEGTIRSEQAVNSDWLERMEESFADFIQPDIYFINEEQELQMTQDIKTFYFGNESIIENNIAEFLLYNGDTMILISAIREARMRAASSNSSIYLYQFSYRGALSEVLDRPIQVDIAGHREELVYLFSDLDTSASTYDLVVSDILVERWTNFAKTGVPTSETSLTPWRQYTLSNSYYLRLLDDEEINENENTVFDVLLERPHPETLVFWDFVYSQHFIDAESRWSLSDRNEEDDDEIIIDEESTTLPPTEEDENDVDEDDGNEPDAASTAVAYTFVIITLFALLERFHMFQIMS